MSCKLPADTFKKMTKKKDINILELPVFIFEMIVLAFILDLALKTKAILPAIFLLIIICYRVWDLRNKCSNTAQGGQNGR